MHSCQKHHHHNHHHHHQHRHDLDHQLFHHHHHHCDGIVRQEEPVQVEEWPQAQRPVPYLGGHILTAALQRYDLTNYQLQVQIMHTKLFCFQWFKCNLPTVKM